MRGEYFKQIATISEKTPEAFENKVNTLLASIPNPEFVFDHTCPFTVTIIYRVKKDMPETVLELLEMLDTGGGNAHCQDCPAFVKSTDKRKVWGHCRRTGDATRFDSRACELYYLERRREAKEIADEFQQIPYEIG